MSCYQQVYLEITQILEIFGRLNLFHKIGQVKIYTLTNELIIRLFTFFLETIYFTNVTEEVNGLASHR